MLFRSLLLNFNHSNIISVFDFLSYTPPTYVYLFDSEGELFRQYAIHIHKPDSVKAELGFETFVASLDDDMLKNCVYKTMIKNVSTNNYKFYLCISDINILEK